MKHIPNIITILRIILSVALIFITPVMGTISFLVFFIAGITDMIDGPLARRIPDGQSKLGADLDAFADMFLIVIGVFVLMPAMKIWDWLWYAVIVVLVVKILSASISGYIKHKTVIFTHTTANKLAALFLFLGPILYFILGNHIIINLYVLFLIVWVLSATIEEALINILIKKPNKNIKGIWEVKKFNEDCDADNQ